MERKVKNKSVNLFFSPFLCQDQERRTPLHAAAWLGDVHIMDLLISAGMKLYSTAATTCSYVLLIKQIILVSNADWSIQNSSLATMQKIVTFMAHSPKFSLYQGLRVDEKLIINYTVPDIK